MRSMLAHFATDPFGDGLCVRMQLTRNRSLDCRGALGHVTSVVAHSRLWVRCPAPDIMPELRPRNSSKLAARERGTYTVMVPGDVEFCLLLPDFRFDGYDP